MDFYSSIYDTLNFIFKPALDAAVPDVDHEVADPWSTNRKIRQWSISPKNELYIPANPDMALITPPPFWVTLNLKCQLWIGQGHSQVRVGGAGEWKLQHFSPLSANWGHQYMHYCCYSRCLLFVICRHPHVIISVTSSKISNGCHIFISNVSFKYP